MTIWFFFFVLAVLIVAFEAVDTIVKPLARVRKAEAERDEFKSAFDTVRAAASRVVDGYEAEVAALLARAEKAEAANGLLTYRGFSCTADHAVECAYLLNLAEADDETGGGDAMTIVSLYVSGDMTMDEALADLAPPAEQESPSCP